MQVQAQLLPSNARVAASVMDAIGKNIRLPTFPKTEHEGHRKVCCHSRIPAPTHIDGQDSLSLIHTRSSVDVVSGHLVLEPVPSR
jgi:hypothetical protein